MTVDLTGAAGSLLGEWFDPSAGETAGTLEVEGGAERTLAAPFAGDAVLYVHPGE